MTKPIVELINVTKIIGSKTIVDNITLYINEGEIFGLLGPNGAGKTTTIKMLVGLLSITSGEIYINGENVKDNFTKAIANVGAIVENPEFYPYLSGYQNLKVFSNMIPHIKKDTLNEAIAVVGLQNRINDKVKTYSLGMRQRLGLAQALLNQPSLLILDEPTNGLDPGGIKELREYLRNLAFNKGVTVIVSSHLLSEMELMCDRIAILQNGKLVDVQKINSEIPVHQSFRMMFEVSDTIKAKEEIIKRFPGLNVIIGNNHLELISTRDDAARINQLLVNKGIKVYGIQSKVKSLEEKFMEITGSEKIV